MRAYLDPLVEALVERPDFRGVAPEDPVGRCRHGEVYTRLCSRTAVHLRDLEPPRLQPPFCVL